MSDFGVRDGSQDTQNENVAVAGSLRRTLMISLVGAALILAAILYIVVRSYAAQIAQTTQDRILSASVTSILDAATIRNGALDVELPYAAFSILSTPADDRFFYAIYQDGNFLSGYSDLDYLPLPDGQMHFESIEFADAPVRIAVGARRLIGASGPVTLNVVVGQTKESLAGVLNRIAGHAALLGGGFFVVMTLFSIWLTAVSILPLTRLAASVHRRGPEDLRPVVSPVPGEMAPLVGSLNNLMRRLDHSLNQSEEFIAEAAHRVRTPLATVRTYAETTLQRVDKLENRQALRSMVRAIDESSRAAGQLLDHAMITFRADHLTKTHLNLSDLARELVRSMGPIAEMKDIELTLTAPKDVAVNGDAILLQNALRNILDNALKYSPPESSITVTVTDNPATFRVQDQGQGFPTAEINTVATRFTRGSNVAGVIGSGLGLTIVKDVATAHDGTLTLNNQPGGGACVELSF